MAGDVVGGGGGGGEGGVMHVPYDIHVVHAPRA